MGKVYPQLATSVAQVAVEVPLSTEAKQPREAAMALELIGQGKTFREVSEATGLSLGQIAAIRKRNRVAIEEHRERFAADGVEMAERLRLVTMAKLQQIADDPEQLSKTNIRDLVLPYAIVQDKVFNALGEAVAVVEHKGGGVSLEEARKMIEEARAAVKEKLVAEAVPVDAVSVEVTKS